MAVADRSIPIIVLAGQSNANSAGIGMAVFDQVRAEGGLYVHTAVSGSSLGPSPIPDKGDWNPYGGDTGGANLKSLIAQVSAMLDPTSPFYVPGAYLDKVVWIQGEADAWVNPLANAYQRNLTALRAAMVDQFGAHQMVISALSDAAIDAVNPTATRRACYTAVQQAQLALAASDPDVYVVDPDTVAAQNGYTPSTMLYSDMVHYNGPTGFATTLGRALMQAGPSGDNPSGDDPSAPRSGTSPVHYVTGTLLNDRLTIAATGLGQAYGAMGTDRLSLTGRSDGVRVEAGGMDAVLVTANGGAAVHLDLVSIEQLVLTGGNDRVIMSATLALVDTWRGDDAVTGRALDDVILLGNGRDTAEGGGGNDTILGGFGSDLLRGDAGNDALFGSNGNDLFAGGTGHDRLFGEAGADTLAGGAGNDRLTGGTGADVFVFGPGDGIDRIADFENGTDLIELHGLPQNLTITAWAGSTWVRTGDLTLILEGIDHSLITAADFTFG